MRGKFNNRSILYLHGYGSSSEGKKAQILRSLYTNNRLLIPDLPLSPLACLEVATDTLQTASNDTLVVGASLGGFYAYYLGCKYKKDCLLINPVMFPIAEGRKILKEETNLEKQQLIQDALYAYESLTSHIKGFSKPPNCFVALGSNDEIIDPTPSKKYFCEAQVRVYDDDHFMLQSFPLIMTDFENYLEDL